MGRVYQAVDMQSGRRVALKVLGARGSEERFTLEAATLARVEHDAVVRYVGHGVSEGGDPFLAMEWLEGGDLALRLRDARLSLPDTLDLADRIAGALACIHAAGIVHRDLKPSNVVFAGPSLESAKIVDFGIARVASGPPVTATGLRLGTLHYMAPEQFFHPRHVDGRVDVFALGCIVFECLTGTRAIDEDDDMAAFARVVLDRARSLRDAWPDAPPVLDALVSRLLARDRDQRPRTGDELRAALAHARAGLTGSAVAAQPPTPHRPVSRAAHTGTELEATALSPHSVRVPAPLPRAAQPIVGRQREVERLDALLGSAGVTTLWGAAGIGKTRLALEMARRWVAAPASPGSSSGALEPRTAAFVSLRACTDEDGVLRAVSAALQPRMPPEGGPAAIERVIARTLQVRDESLTVLDAAEHLASIVDSLLVRWTAEAPLARFLVTGRDKPRSGGALELGPLAVDGPGSDASLLFLARAGDTAAGIESDPASREAVVRIVRSLDGNPLAIELAAARLDVLGLDALGERLSRPLALLGGARPASSPDGRSWTMAETLAWSWDLLTADEKSALARCSVFRGSFTADAAERVLEPGPETPVLDQLHSLRNRSLLAPTIGDTSRLSLSSAVRDFARAKLDELGLAEDSLRRHAAYYVAWATPLAARVSSRGDVGALRALATETEQLLAAVETMLGHSASDALRGLLALDPVLAARGPFDRHLELLDRALAQVGTSPGTSSELVANARQARGRLLSRSRRHDEARADLEHAVDHAVRGGDADREVAARLDLGVAFHAQHRLAEARREYEIVAGLGTDHPFVEARALGNLGALHHDQGRFDDAYTCYVEAIALFDSIGDPRATGLFLANLAMLDMDRGRVDDAGRRYARALRELEAAGDKRLLAIALGSAGMYELELGRPDTALPMHERARALLGEVDDPRSEALCLGRLGATLACLGQLEPALAAVARGERTARRDAETKATVALFRAFLDVAEAQRDLSEGRPDAARAAARAARERVDAASRAREGAPPLTAVSDDARAALRALGKRLGPVEAALRG